jgi:uncharacterized protein (DUF2147 family)
MRVQGLAVLTPSCRDHNLAGKIMKTGQSAFTRFGIVIAVVLVLSLLVACSSKPEDACLGKWSTDNGSAKLELFKDGKIKITETHVLVHGKYSFVDKDKIKVELEGYEHVGGPPIITVAFAGEEMTWTYPNGEVLKYKRMS